MAQDTNTEQTMVMNATEHKETAIAAYNSTKRAGCTCNPDIRVFKRDGWVEADIAHDAWCPVLR